MKPSEILERSRMAVVRMDAIDDEIRDLHDRIGVQGHTYGFHGKNDIRDPMRHVDEMIDGTVELEMEKSECMRDVYEATLVIDGLRALDESKSLMTDCEYVLTEYYVYAKGMHEVARGAGQPIGLTRMLVREALRICDEVGMAGLMAARKRRVRIG